MAATRTKKHGKATKKRRSLANRVDTIMGKSNSSMTKAQKLKVKRMKQRKIMKKWEKGSTVRNQRNSA